MKMNKLLATSAIALVALSGAASAQSVLERVLTQIDNSTNLASVNGTFANVAENIGGATAVNTYAAQAVSTGSSGTALAADSSQAMYDAWVAGTTVADSAVSETGDLVYYNPTTGQLIRTADYNNLTGTQRTGFVTVTAGDYIIVNADGTYDTATGTAATLATDIAARNTDLIAAAEGVTTAYTGTIEGINGSINNTISGLTAATQEAIAGTVTATDWGTPTVNLGDMATTALGAVNTGDITLGVNSAVDNAQTSTTTAISNVMNQIGGSADTGAIVLNVASNMTGVNGSINNTMASVNGSIGNLSTTALGAVNTGTITSGVNAAVQGIVGSTAGQ
jgi:hypothetical protein